MASDLLAILASEGPRVGDYVLLKALGKGSLAEVRLARHLLTGAEVVIKAISQRGFSGYFQEAHCLKSVNHPNIIKLFEVIATWDKLYLVMEHISGGDLSDYLELYGRMSEEEARAAFRQVASALQHCHQRGIVHRDLKPDNILVDSDVTLKVADFGFAKEVYDYKLSTYCGTLSYMAPEILRGQAYDGQKADVWSLGVLLYRMMMGVVPFKGDDIGELKREILKGHFYVPFFLSRDAENLLMKLLNLDPSQRPTLEEIMKHPWVNKDGKAALEPYCESPCDDLDPEVMEMMGNLGFNHLEIQESITHKKFDRVMGTYLILRMRKTRMRGRTVWARPRPAPALPGSASLTQEVLLWEETKKEPAIRSSYLWSTMTVPPPSLVSRTTTTPLSLPKSRATTPSPAPQSGPEGSPTTRTSRSTSSSGGAQEKATHENCLKVGKTDETPASPDGGTPASPDGGTPASPDGGTPASPGGGTPASPDGGTPASPGGGTPASPGGGTPASPGGETPASPDGGTPASPGGETPASPGGGTPAPPDGETPASPDGETPASPDGGTPAPPEGGTPVSPDGGTPAPPEGGTPASPDGGTPAPPDGGTPASPDGGTPASPGGRTPASPGGRTPASPSGHSQGRQGLARRVFRFVFSCICCGPPTKKKPLRRTKVVPL